MRRHVAVRVDLLQAGRDEAQTVAASTLNVGKGEVDKGSMWHGSIRYEAAANLVSGEFRIAFRTPRS